LYPEISGASSLKKKGGGKAKKNGGEIKEKKLANAITIFLDSIQNPLPEGRENIKGRKRVQVGRRRPKVAPQLSNPPRADVWGQHEY